MPVSTEALADANKTLKLRGIRGSLEDHSNRWYWRTSCSIDRGPRKQQRVSLGLPADGSSVNTAIDRIQAAALRYKDIGTLMHPLPWEISTLEEKNLITVADATDVLRQSFFRKKQENK